MPECPVKMKTTLKINLLSLLSYFDFNKLLHELFITIRNQSKGLLAIVPCFLVQLCYQNCFLGLTLQ